MGRLPRRFVATLLAAWLGAAPAVEAAGRFVLPATLPAGRVGTPLVSLKPSIVGAWRILRVNLPGLMGPALPAPALWAALDDAAGAAAAGPLKDRLPSTWWADLLRWDALDAPAQQKLRDDFMAAHRDAAQAVALETGQAFERIAREAGEGKIGAGDLESLETQLRGYAIYGTAAREAHEELKAALDERRALKVEKGLSGTAANFRVVPITATGEGGIAGGESKTTAVLERSNGGAVVSARRAPPAPREEEPEEVANDPELRAWGSGLSFSGLLKVYGYAALGVAAAMTLGAWAQTDTMIGGFGPLHTVFIWAGAGLVALGGLFGKSPQASRPPPSPRQRAEIPESGALGWLLRQWTAAREWLKDAQFTVAAQKRLAERAAGGTWRDKAAATVGVFRTALYWLPAAFLGMAAAGGLGFALKAVWPGAGLPLSAYATGGASPTAFTLANDMMAGMVLADLITLGLVFGPVRWVWEKLGLEERLGVRANWVAGAAAMAAFMVLTAAQGQTVVTLMGLMGLQAAFIALRAKTGGLAAPMALRLLIFGVMAQVVRMSIGLTMSTGGTLAGLPDWIGLAAAGVAATVLLAGGAIRHWASSGWGFLKTTVRGELARLRRVGRWWMRRPADGAPRSPLPILTTGFAWGVATYLVMEAAWRLVHYFVPGTEPVPEVLKRTLLLPFDLVAFNMVIVAGLEEWVFRRGLFRPLGDFLKGIQRRQNWKPARWWAWPAAALHNAINLVVRPLGKFRPARWWFWPAAIISSLIFSGAHYIDMSSWFDSDKTLGLAMTYHWSWAGFAARAAGGMMLAFLYARTRTLLIPIGAHFLSNTLESAGLRWGPIPFLVGVAAVLALHWWQSGRPLNKAEKKL